MKKRIPLLPLFPTTPSNSKERLNGKHTTPSFSVFRQTQTGTRVLRNGFRNWGNGVLVRGDLWRGLSLAIPTVLLTEIAIAMGNGSGSGIPPDLSCDEMRVRVRQHERGC